MTPEDRVDRLISRRFAGDRAPTTEPDEVAPLAAAEELVNLRQIRVPATLASGLEARLRQAARDQQQREQRGMLPLALPRRTPHARRWVTGLASAAAILVVLGVVVLNASAASLPGDPLYSLKQFRNQIALSQAHTPATHAQVAIQQLQAAVQDLRAEVAAGHNDDAIAQAITVVAQDTSSAQGFVNSIPPGAALDQAQSDLAGALTDEQTTLRQLLPAAHWPVRVALTRQLGALGASVPTISQITASFGNSSLITLNITGTNFASGAQVFVNGVTITTVRSSSATQIVAAVERTVWNGQTHLVGVQNPDGTATQFTVPGRDTHDHKTPEPTSIPAAGKDHGHGTPTPDPHPGNENHP